MPPSKLDIAEIFCGAGGMSYGLREAGITPRLGIDLNPHCIATYRRNFPEAHAVVADVRELRSTDILKHIHSRDRLVFAGCPPCQLFSQLHRSCVSESKEFEAYLRLLWSVNPAFIVFENVPRIMKWEHLWNSFCERLRRRGYSVWYSKVCASQFGVPQKRQRLVLIASRIADVSSITLPANGKISTVRDAISAFPDVDDSIPNHRTMRLSTSNQKRIEKTPFNGGLSKSVTSSFGDSYGRMRWDLPAPTITTKCISFSNGRFGHPVYNRAITVREAAVLQGVPTSFVFDGPLKEGARQVGNAAPPPLARWIGQQVAKLV